MPDKRQAGKEIRLTDRIKETLRERNKQGFSGSSEDREFLAMVRPLQQEFQREHCPSCERYDPVRKRYRESGHQNDPVDCRWHWTDLMGTCWNYRARPDDERQEREPLADDETPGITFYEFLQWIFKW